MSNWDKTMNQTIAEINTAYPRIEIQNEVTHKDTDAVLDIIGKELKFFKIRDNKDYVLQWIKHHGFEVCKKKDSIGNITVGDMINGCFVYKNYKCYYLKNK